MTAGRRRQGALVGFGQVAERAHAPAFARSGLAVAAVADASPERLRAALAAFPGARGYATLEALLAAEKEIEFVDIATPPFLHGRLALAAIEAGRHVLCEKPLCVDLAEFEGLSRRAAAAGRRLFTVHNWAHSPQWLKVFELASSGALGEIRHVELHALRTRPAAGSLPGDWRTEAAKAGGGILVDHGWHNLYLLHRLIPEAPRRVSGRLHPEGGRTAEDEATLFLEYPEATALVHLSWRAGLRSNWAAVVGSRARLELRDSSVVVEGSDAPPRAFEFPEKLSAGSAHPDWFAGTLAEFEAALEDRAAARRNAEEAAFCLRTISRAYQAARVGRSPLRDVLHRSPASPR